MSKSNTDNLIKWYLYVLILSKFIFILEVGGLILSLKEDFGKSLKAIRTLKGITQEKLAELIGIEQRQLSRIETGKSFISFGTLEKICLVLDVAPAELFKFDLDAEITNINSEVKY